MIGRPMGMSCGCPITHCGIVTDVDPRNGVINWCVTGPLRPRNEGFIDIGYYVAQGYEGLIREAKEEIKLGKDTGSCRADACFNGATAGWSML